jgi:hypothetical protein
MLWFEGSFRVRIPRNVAIRWIFRLRTANTRPPITATVAVHSKNMIIVDSALNYHLMDEESTRGMVIPRELPAHGR